MTKPYELRGSVVPLISPLTWDEQIDTDALTRLMAFQKRHGTDGIFLLGTCGEGPCLTDASKERLLDAALERSNGLPILAGIVETGTRRAVEWARKADRLGISALVVVLPTFHLTKNVWETVAHVRAIAEAVETPLIMYNLPKKTGGVEVSIEAVQCLLEERMIIGIKDSSGDLDYFSRLLALRDVFPWFRVMNGELRRAAEALRRGADGLVMSYTNVEPDKCKLLIEAVRQEDFEQANLLQQRFLDTWKAFPSDASPAARVKAILAAHGFCKSLCCAPAASLEPMIPESLKKECSCFVPE